MTTIDTQEFIAAQNDDACTYAFLLGQPERIHPTVNFEESDAE
jgi:hypothetical protein